MPDPNVVILNSAWSLLWRQTSPYYLPTILANGATFGNAHIPALATVALSDISIPLFTSDVWGNVSIKLTSATVRGLPTIQNRSFTPSSDARSITAQVAFQTLTFSGSYELDGTGLAGCAMDVAGFKAYNPADAPPPEYMDLARQYRDRLVRSNNGAALVGKYYDHNDAVNVILNGDNVFTRRWPGGATPTAPNTAYYMRMTADATAHPDDPDYTVGDDGYQMHGGFMEASLVRACLDEAEHDSVNADALRALAKDAVDFKGYTDHYPDPMTADGVMAKVTNAQPMTAAELAAVPEPEAVRAGRLAAEQGLDELRRTIAAERAARAHDAPTYKSTGRFSFDFPMPSLTFSGTVAIRGIQPHLTITATLKSLQAEIPSLQIRLLTSTDPRLTADSQTVIDAARWFQKSLGSYVNAKLGSEEILSYLSGVINQAILNILAG
jgi:hypothetical protein